MSEISWQKNREVPIRNLADLEKFAIELRNLLPEKCVVALVGPMAAGKTELVKLYGRARGVSDVSSPTFALHQRYVTDQGDIEHWDLYRLESDEELEATGFWDLFSSAAESRQIFIEWPQKMRLSQISKSWPLLQIEFHIISDQERLLKMAQRI